MSDKQPVWDLIIAILKEQGEDITPARENAIKKAFVSRGKNKGYLKASPPSFFDEQLAYAAWSGMQPNGYKVKPWSLMSLGKEGKDFFLLLSKYSWPTRLDRDSHVLDQMGVWP